MQTDVEPLLDETRPLFLRTLQLPSTLRVVVLAPHPDDFDAIGVTMRTLRDNGNRIDVAVLTSGGSGVDDDFAPRLTIQEKATIREQEQSASCRFFGLPPERLTFLRLDEDTEGHLEVSGQNPYLGSNLYSRLCAWVLVRMLLMARPRRIQFENAYYHVTCRPKEPTKRHFAILLLGDILSVLRHQ